MNASLDVSFILTDPQLCSTFNVFRRKEVVDSHGYATSDPTLFPNVIGVVCSGNTNDLSRGDTYDVSSRAISVVTKFPLQGETEGYNGDVIYWRGSSFLVKQCDIYQQFGAGFYEAHAESMNHLDQAVPPGWAGNAVGTGAATPALCFNIPNNSAMEAVCF